MTESQDLITLYVKPWLSVDTKKHNIIIMIKQE